MREILKQFGEPLIVVTAVISIVVLLFVSWNSFDPSKPPSILTEIGSDITPLAKKEHVEKPISDLVDQTKQTSCNAFVKTRAIQGDTIQFGTLLGVDCNEQLLDGSGNPTSLLKYTWNETNKRFEVGSSTQKGIVEVLNVKDQTGVQQLSTCLTTDASGVRSFTFAQCGLYTIKLRVTTENKTTILLNINVAVDIKNI